MTKLILAMPKAYSYIRFSSAIQQKGDSLKRQIALREEYLSKHPELELDTTLNMTDLGISAFDRSNITKGALGKFLTAVNDGKIERGSYLLVESLDRLSRAEINDALPVFLNIINAGITIASLADGMVYSRKDDSNNFANLMMSILVMSRAAEESATKSRRIRRNWDNKRANISTKRLTARCPYWMKPSLDETGFVLIPDRVETVHKIFQMSKDGIGNATIAKRLNEEGIELFSKKTNGWRDSYIHKILNSKSIYGEFPMHLQRDGEITALENPVMNYYPAIMSKEEWLWNKSIRAERRTRGGVSKGKHLSNLFSGLLKCGYCQGSMVMGGCVSIKRDGTRRESKYVACSSARRGLGCRYVQWNYPELEHQIIEFCRSVDFAAVINKKSTSITDTERAHKDVIRIGMEIGLLKAKLDNILIALENNSDSAPATIITRISEIENQLMELKADKESAELHAVRMEANGLTESLQQNALDELLNQLQNFKGSELHDLRIKLSERIKKSIQHIHLFPIGPWASAEKLKEIELNFLKLGYTKNRIKKYFTDLNVASIKSNRYLFILFKNGETLSVGNKGISLNFNKLTVEEYQRGLKSK